MSFLIDTHAHLDFPELYSKLDAIIQNAKDQNILKIISISINLNKIQKIINISNNYPEIYYSVGTHPNEVLNDNNCTNYELISKLSKDSRCVAIGECGLDYHFGNEDKNLQKYSFITQINVARDNDLPVIIHSRDADEDMINIVTEEYKKGPFKAILHCFSSGRDLAICGIDLGFYISFSGIVTFNSAKSIQEIARLVPDSQILVETDSPYLAPVPVRGRMNEPMNCIHTAKYLSDLRKTNFENFTQYLYNNTLNIFKKIS